MPQSGSSLCREAYIRYLVSIRNLVNLPYKSTSFLDSDDTRYLHKFVQKICDLGPTEHQRWRIIYSYILRESLIHYVTPG